MNEKDEEDEEFEIDDESKCRIGSPIFLITSTEDCWRCGIPQPVIALASCSVLEADQDDEDAETSGPVILSSISRMPDEIERYLTSRFPRCQMHRSRTAGYAYFTNFCECGANFGDFYLHNEPGGAFFPTSEKEAEGMSVERLPFEGTFEFECSPGHSRGSFIFKHAKHNGE